MQIRILSAALIAAFALAACGGSNNTAPAAQQGASAASPAAASDKVALDITGAGASFPQPIYVQWAQAYQAASGGRINYQSIGSSGGVKQITAKTVDFGASDSPLKADDLEKEGVVQ